MSDEAAGAGKKVRAEGALETCFQIIHLDSAIGAVGYIKLGFAFGPIDEDTVGTGELAGAASLSVDAAEVATTLVEPVDIAFTVPVGDPNIPVATVAFLVDCHERGDVVTIPVNRQTGLGQRG